MRYHNLFLRAPRHALRRRFAACVVCFISGHAVALGLEWPAPKDHLSSLAGALDYLTRHARDVALVSYTVGDDSEPEPAEPVLLHQPDEPMPLMSTLKIVHLAAYAREVAAGRIDPDEPLALAEWERFYLPGTDAGAHASALKELDIPTDGFGFALDPSTAVPLDKAVRAMIRHSDNAVPDYLLERLGEATVRAAIAEAGIQELEVPLSILGQFLAWDNHEQGTLTDGRLAHLLSLSPEQYAAEVDWLHDLYYQDETWRREELAWRRRERPFHLANLRRAIDALAPRGTAREVAGVMARTLSGTLLSPEANAIVRRHLEWLMELPGISDLAHAVGFKGGSGPGVLTGASYSVARVGGFAGSPRVTVLFLRRVPIEDWDELVESDGFREWVISLASDRTVVETVIAALCIPGETTLCVAPGRFRRHPERLPLQEP